MAVADVALTGEDGDGARAAQLDVDRLFYRTRGG
jgi:hypothetical protein